MVSMKAIPGPGRGWRRPSLSPALRPSHAHQGHTVELEFLEPGVPLAGVIGQNGRRAVLPERPHVRWVRRQQRA